MGLSSKNILQRDLGSFEAPLSPIQQEVDGLVTRFAEEATDPATLAAITAGGMAYRLGRVGVMGLPIGAGNTPLRIASLAVGLGSEVTAFEFTNRTLQTFFRSPITDHQSRNLWSWSGPGGWQKGLASSAVTFGLLRGAGFLAREQNIVLQHAFQSTAMVGGHQIAGALRMAPAPQGSLAEQLLHAEATNLQMIGGLSLLHGLAPSLPAFERVLDVQSQGQTTFRRPFGPSLATETVSAQGRPSFSSAETNTVWMSSVGDGPKGRGPAGPRSEDELGEGRANVSFPSSVVLGEGKELPEMELLELIRKSFPEEILKRVETAAAILNPHIPEVRHKPILLMAQALAEALDSFNRDLDLFPLNGNPADRSKILRLRNWIRDSFGEYLKLPGFAPVGIHYDRSLAYISLLSLEEEASQHLTSPLSDQVLAKVRSLQELPSDDPRLSRDLRVLGTQVGAFSRDTYLALLDFALKNGLVTRRLDSVNNPLLNGFRRRYRRLHPEGFPPIEPHRIEQFYELELMVNHLRDKWGSFSPFLRGYDKEFNQLDKSPQDGLQRYQILKRLESFLLIMNEMDPSDGSDGDSD